MLRVEASVSGLIGCMCVVEVTMVQFSAGFGRICSKGKCAQSDEEESGKESVSDRESGSSGQWDNPVDLVVVVISFVEEKITQLSNGDL